MRYNDGTCAKLLISGQASPQNCPTCWEQVTSPVSRPSHRNPAGLATEGNPGGYMSRKWMMATRSSQADNEIPSYDTNRMTNGISNIRLILTISMRLVILSIDWWVPVQKMYRDPTHPSLNFSLHILNCIIYAKRLMIPHHIDMKNIADSYRWYFK